MYDFFYRTMGENNYSLTQTFESLIYPNTEQVTILNETFYIHIPTKYVENLKKIRLIFLIQTLENPTSAIDKKVIKPKRISENLHLMSKISFIIRI